MKTASRVSRVSSWFLTVAFCLYGLSGCPPSSDLHLVTNTASVTVPENNMAGFQVRLSSPPSTAVSVSVMRLFGDTDITVEVGASLTFTLSNWSVYQTVLLAAADDADRANGTGIFRCTGAGVANAEVLATELDDDTSGTAVMIETDKGLVDVPEGGSADFQVRLSSPPASDVVISVANVAGDSGISVQSGVSLTFTPALWNVYQPVTLHAAEDVDTTNGTATIRCSAVGLSSIDLTATEADNDSAGPSVAIETDKSLVNVPEGGTARFQVKLSAPPEEDVTISVANVAGDTDLSVQVGARLTFATGLWNVFQAVTLYAAEEADTIYGSATIRCSGEGISSADVTAVELDDDKGAPGQTETILLPGGVPLEMVWIPEGTFRMGRYFDEQDGDVWEDPQHQVTLTHGYWIGKYEVTQAQWKAVMNGTNPSWFQGENVGNENTDNRPVEQISWHDIQEAFLPALSTATGLAFRLPTEAEWEHAARANTGWRFHWGDDPDYIDIDDYAWYADNSQYQTHDAGRKLPNVWGLHDMSGNVWEFCQDGFYSYASGWVSDPMVPAFYDSFVIRGGAYFEPGGACRSASRHDGSYGFSGLGFRLVSSVDVSAWEPGEDSGGPTVTIATDKPSVEVPEGGTADFQVRLSARPASDVTISIANVAGDSDISVQSGENLTFSTTLWNVFQAVTLYAAEDADALYGASIFRCRASGLPGVSSIHVTATEHDNDIGTPGQTETVMLPGGVPLEMVWIPEGTFMMGRYPGEQDTHYQEYPQHQVTLTHGFLIGKYELTQAQWKAVMNGANPSLFQGDEFGDTDNRPVENVSWEDITQTFLPALNSATGLIFRLPSEAEWEYACRAETDTRFYWGDDPSYTDIGMHAWYSSNSGDQTHDVGTAGTTGQPNMWNLYDTIGNVWEYCQDWYGRYGGEAVVDPTGPATGWYRVIRGGGWGSLDFNCGSAARGTNYTQNPTSNTGIRLAR